jgi:hypothetical protein
MILMNSLGGSQTARVRAGWEGGRPLFLVGAPRSGTSLVYRALSLHPEAAYMSNWLRRRPRWPALSLLNRLPRALPGLQLRYWFGEESNAYRFGRRRSLLERAFPAPIEGAPVFEACGVGEADRRPSPEQAACLRRAFAALLRFGGGTTVVSKRIANNRLIPFLAEAFPESRFVSIVRDGRAVAYSLSRVDWWEEAKIWWLGVTPEQWRAAGKDDWELCARVWVEEVRVVEAGLAALDPERVLQVSYEQLVGDPIAQLQRIAGFGGLAESSSWTAALGRLKYANQNEAWRQRLSADQTERLEKIQAEELRRHGYL